MDRKTVARELVRAAKELTAAADPMVTAELKSALPALERQLKPMFGFVPRLVETGSAPGWVRFEDEVGGGTLGVFSAVFKKASVKVRVTTEPLSDGSYFTQVSLIWESHRGGTNGAEVATAWFYPDKGTWLVEAAR